MYATKYWPFNAILAFVIIIAGVPDIIHAIGNVRVTVPAAVKRGDNAMLICNYDLEGDVLYQVKWYRRRREFYRYTPKENPAGKTFAGIAPALIDINQSNASHVFIRNVPLTMSGKYSCEVSADAPSFHTILVGGEMEVVELPITRPIITGIHSRYRLGDIINGNCSSDYSKPAANLTWWINDIPVPLNYIRPHAVQKNPGDNLESSTLEVNFVVTLQHFIKGLLRLKCSCHIHDIYSQETEKLVEEDRPRILASGRSPEMNMYPFDPPTDEFRDQNELYLTHYDSKSASSWSRLLAPFETRLFCLHTFAIIFVRQLLTALRR